LQWLWVLEPTAFLWWVPLGLVGQWDFATFQESGWGLWVLVAEDEAWVAGLASAQVSALARAEYAEPVFAAVVVVPDAVSVEPLDGLPADGWLARSACREKEHRLHDDSLLHARWVYAHHRSGWLFQPEAVYWGLWVWPEGFQPAQIQYPGASWSSPGIREF
jgi:hypothetical protein